MELLVKFIIAFFIGWYSYTLIRRVWGIVVDMGQSYLLDKEATLYHIVYIVVLWVFASGSLYFFFHENGGDLLFRKPVAWYAVPLVYAGATVHIVLLCVVGTAVIVGVCSLATRAILWAVERVTGYKEGR